MRTNFIGYIGAQNIPVHGIIARFLEKRNKLVCSYSLNGLSENVLEIEDAAVFLIPAALKRFKEDVKEVGTNFECGISLTSQDDIKVGDIIETFVQVEVKQKL